MKNFSFNEEQIEWLTVIVKYRLDDETAEKNDKLLCEHTENMDVVEHRIRVWQSIYDELTKK